MLLVQCQGCQKVAFAQNHQDPDSALVCGCCPVDHDHAAAANACTGAHADEACPKDTGCLVLTPLGEPCPGGHCAKGVPGCTVCRPVTITLPPGQVHLKPAFELPPGVIEAAQKLLAGGLA